MQQMEEEDWTDADEADVQAVGQDLVEVSHEEAAAAQIELRVKGGSGKRRKKGAPPGDASAVATRSRV